MTQAVKYMSGREFRDEGYLQEVNRRFFHPLGLALEMNMDDPDDKAWFSGIWDERDDPEGISFVVNEEFEPAFVEKAENIEMQWRLRRRPRVEALKYMIQPWGDEFRTTGSDIMQMFGDALGEEMSKVIPVKASSESWQKAMRGIFDKVCYMFAEEPYNPQNVTPEEVHLMDLVLGPEALTGARTRVEALNMLVDSRQFYKDIAEEATTALKAIASGDITPGTSPQDAADIALSTLASMYGG